MLLAFVLTAYPFIRSCCLRPWLPAALLCRDCPSGADGVWLVWPVVAGPPGLAVAVASSTPAGLAVVGPAVVALPVAACAAGRGVVPADPVQRAAGTSTGEAAGLNG
jgi:hypothetical protein